MNTMELEALGLVEINEQEAQNVDGGWLWIPIAIGMFLYSQDVF